MSSVSIVILNYNGRKYFEQFLPSVIRYSQPHEIVIADNSSTDDSIDYVRKHFPRIRLILLDQNYGFTQGYNKALSQLDADYFVLLNSDVEVTENWLDPLIQVLDQNNDIGACQPKILSYHNKNQFEYAGAAGGFIDSLGYPFCRGRLFHTLEADVGQYDNDMDIFWSSGACMIIRASLFKEVGGFDNEFFAHMEEIDLCWRIHHAGSKVSFCGKSTVYHVGGGTLDHTNPKKTYLNFRNGLILIFKNLSLIALLWKFPVRIILDLIASIKFLFFDSPAHTLSVLRAHWYFIVTFKSTIIKRKYSRRLNVSDNRLPTYPGSIVFDYFLRRRKKFQDLNF